MAFPTPVNATSTAEPTDVTSGTVNLPAVSSGDLLVICCGADQTPTLTFPGSPAWQTITLPNDTGIAAGAVYRIIDGTEGWGSGGSIEVAISSGNQFAAVAFRIPSSEYDHDTPIVGNATISGDTTSQNPDPPLSNPGTAADYCFIEWFIADDDDDTATYWSTDFTGIAQIKSNTGTGTCLLAVAYRQLNASSLDPGTMAMAASEDHRVHTFAIKPAAAAVVRHGGMVRPSVVRQALNRATSWMRRPDGLLVPA
jgi:hypothetical protein